MTLKKDKKKLAVGTIVIGVILVGLLASIFSPRSLEALYFQNAQFEKSDFRLKPAAGMVLSIRKTKESLLSLNTQERILIWISSLKESTYEFSDSSKSLWHFSKSVVDHPELNCEADIHSGQLEILSVEAEHIKIRLLASIACLKKDGTQLEVIQLDQGYALTSHRLDEMSAVQ